MKSAAKDLERAAELLAPVSLLRGDAVKLEPVRWAWRGFLPLGMLTILGGAPGCGKTTIALSLAATITRGGSWPDGTRCGPAGDVVIWSGEDADSVTAARLKAAGADMRRVHFVSSDSADAAFDPGRDMPRLESAIEGLEAPRLLILDPIVSAVAGDSHKGAEVRRSLQPVVDLGKRVGCAVLGITHFSKGTAGRDPVERVTGSIAFAALARLVLVAAKVRGEPAQEGEPRRVLMRAKSNIGADDGGFAYTLVREQVAAGVEGQRVQWLEALEGTASELLAEAESEPQVADAATASEDAAAHLRDVLTGQAPLASREVERLMLDEGYSKKATRRAREKLGVVIQREGFGRETRTLWSLPLVPTDSHSRPLVPAQSDGHEGARVQRLGTNGSADMGGGVEAARQSPAAGPRPVVLTPGIAAALQGATAKSVPTRAAITESPETARSPVQRGIAVPA